MTCKGKGANARVIRRCGGLGALAEMARSNRWMGSVEISRASSFKSTSSMIHNYSIRLVKRATLFLCLAGVSAGSSLAASISPRRTADRYSTTASERP